jgi:hypothetical protein
MPGTSSISGNLFLQRAKSKRTGLEGPMRLGKVLLMLWLPVF